MLQLDSSLYFLSAFASLRFMKILSAEKRAEDKSKIKKMIYKTKMHELLKKIFIFTLTGKYKSCILQNKLFICYET